MITRTSERNHTSTDYDTETNEAESLESAKAVQEQARAKARADGVEEKSSLGSKALVASTTKRASSNPAKADAARAAVAPLAAQLPGHGIDVDTFAARFGGAKYGKLDAAHVAQQARYEFMREALTNNPKLADRAIAVRLTGAGQAEHDIVRMACAGRAGLARYTRCESVMARLHSFTADQRADIEGMMKNLGYAFEKATGQLQKEHALVETSTDPGASLHTLIVPALRSIRADADYWQRACARMNAAYRSIPALDRDFERATGVAASVGTVGSFAAASLKAQVTLSTKPLQQALDDAERAGSHIAAELSGAIGCANAIYRRFGEQYSSYVEASRRLECATAQFDGAEVKEARAEVEKLDRAMKQTMSEFLPLADKLRAKGREFDKSVRKAVVDLSVSGASLAANGIAKPIETVWEGAAEAVLGGAIESPIAEEVHHAVERLSE